MKEINMMDGNSIIISIEEWKNISKAIGSGYKGLVELRNGDLVNTSSISSITTPQLEPYYNGGKMDKSLRTVLIGGERKIFAGRLQDIEWKLKNHPEIAVPPVLAKKLLINKSKDVVDFEIDPSEQYTNKLN